MVSSATFNTAKTSTVVSWKSTGMLQKTIGKCIEKWGIGLHSGKSMAVKIWPELAGKGRYFDVGSNTIQASIDFVEQESPLCTTLSKDGVSVRTVEHLLSALEATGVDNCRIQITSADPDYQIVEVPILDGSAREWVEAIDEAGLEDAIDEKGNSHEKMAPSLNEPVHIRKNDAFVAAFPAPEIHITYGINFPKVPLIGCQWFFSNPFNKSLYASDIAFSRTFCVYEEVEQMREMGLIKGGSLENAIVCSASKGWLNSSLRFDDEPCRHKVLDIVGDLSLFARPGSQGLPIAHIIAYKDDAKEPSAQDGKGHVVEHLPNLPRDTIIRRSHMTMVRKRKGSMVCALDATNWIEEEGPLHLEAEEESRLAMLCTQNLYVI